jgi:hypothetical protein
MINIVYTNSKCQDVFNIFKTQHGRFSRLPLFVISDNGGDFTYKNEEPYYKHWLDALKLVNDDFFIYNQEDFILYHQLNHDVLNQLEEFLIQNPQYSFVRLIKSGQRLSNNQIGKNIFEVNDDSFPLYSMQATIWNKNKFVELYENTKQEKWFESQSYEDACKKLNIRGVYYYNGEPKRGGHHDSSIYPYIATAVVKGKWNLSEYKNELLPLLNEHNIVIENRGIF